MQSNDAEILEALNVPTFQAYLPLPETPPAGIQLKLRGVFTSMREGCPQLINGKCSDRGMSPCTYDQTPRQPCPVLQDCIKRWKKENEYDH